MKIGDKVVCVNPVLNESLTRLRVIGEVANVQGRVYVITGCHVNRHYGTLGLSFAGSSVFYGSDELGWLSDRFRLLSEMREESKNRNTQREPVRERNEVR